MIGKLGERDSDRHCTMHDGLGPKGDGLRDCAPYPGVRLLVALIICGTGIAFGTWPILAWVVPTIAYGLLVTAQVLGTMACVLWTWLTNLLYTSLL